MNWALFCVCFLLSFVPSVSNYNPNSVKTSREPIGPHFVHSTVLGANTKTTSPKPVVVKTHVPLPTATPTIVVTIYPTVSPTPTTSPIETPTPIPTITIKPMPTIDPLPEPTCPPLPTYPLRQNDKVNDFLPIRYPPVCPDYITNTF